jgi:hypothetical protein
MCPTLVFSRVREYLRRRRGTEGSKQRLTYFLDLRKAFLGMDMRPMDAVGTARGLAETATWREMLQAHRCAAHKFGAKAGDS